ncbi:unnamed protein product [Protopolystoma xenopodis]|uniref:Uncharacterized protein n=1 Tax=Protopolystoma xenopodis TaxID=117903 RepID=A0A448WNW8_9PLAT|nr:unnamed protein product [Protopolystoma xenopodis]
MYERKSQISGCDKRRENVYEVMKAKSYPNKVPRRSASSAEEDYPKVITATATPEAAHARK